MPRPVLIRYELPPRRSDAPLMLRDARHAALLPPSCRDAAADALLLQRRRVTKMLMQTIERHAAADDTRRAP